MPEYINTYPYPKLGIFALIWRDYSRSADTELCVAVCLPRLAPQHLLQNRVQDYLLLPEDGLVQLSFLQVPSESLTWTCTCCLHLMILNYIMMTKNLLEKAFYHFQPQKSSYGVSLRYHIRLPYRIASFAYDIQAKAYRV